MPESDAIPPAEPLSRGLVVGLGSIGRRHLGNLGVLLPGAELAVLRRPGSPPCDGARVVHSLEEALAFRPGFAVLANPSPLHLEPALALARAGVHLLVEKPIADSAEGVGGLVALARARGLVLMTGYNLRFTPGLRAMKAALDGGRIGRPLGFRAEVGQYLPDWRPGTDPLRGVTARPELGGGAVLELSHEFDAVRMLLGEVEQVCAWTATLGDLGLEVEDTAEALLRMACGALGSVHLDLLQRTPRRQCRIFGTGGTLAWDGLTQATRLFRAGEGWMDLHPGGDWDRNRMYLDELAHFFHCIRTGSTPEVDGEAGLRALEIALAVKRSAREGRPVRPGEAPCEP